MEENLCFLLISHLPEICKKVAEFHSMIIAVRRIWSLRIELLTQNYKIYEGFPTNSDLVVNGPEIEN